MNRSMGEGGGGGNSIYNGRKRFEMAIIIDLDWRGKLISGTSGHAIAEHFAVQRDDHSTGGSSGLFVVLRNVSFGR